MERYVFLVFLLILALILVAPQSNASGIIQTLGGAATNQIVALQGGTPQPLNGGR